MKSRPVSVNVTANGLAANQAQQTANQAVASANKYRTEWEEVNSENLAALSTAQSEFESNLAWAKSQIYEGQHQNDSALASLQSDMESSWNSMSTVEESLYNSASTATSEVDSHLESLRAQNSQSMADLHSAANSLHAAANSLHADADAMRSSLTAATSELGKDITSTRNSLDGVRNSLRAATSEVGNNLVNARNSLAAVDADLRNGIKQAGTDLANAKTSLTATGNSLATATSELQRRTGQISGSLSTADSMIMFNSNAIAEVKRTAGEISTTVSNIRVGDRNIAQGNAGGKDWYAFTGFNGTINYYADLVGYSLSTLKAGDKVTFGITMKNEGVTSGTMCFQQHGDVTLWDRDYSHICPDINVAELVPAGTEKALTYTITITSGMLDGNSSYILQVRTDNIPAGGKLSFRYAFVKKGTMATDWTPAPEDTDQAISKVSQTADAIRADLTNTKGDVASVKATASSLQSQITDNKNNISSVKQTADSLTSTVGQMPAKWQQAINDKASAQVLTSGVDMNNLTTAGTYLIKDFSVKNAPISAYFMATVAATADHTRVVQRVKRDADNIAYERSNYDKGWTAWERVATGTDVSSIQQTMSGITTRVSNAEGDVSSLQQTAKGLQSSIANAQGDIYSLKQTASGLTSRVGNAEGSISQLQQTANGLQSTVSNIRVGGRNLVLGTQEAKTIGTTYANISDATLESGYYWPDRQRVVLKEHLSNLGLTYNDTLTVTGTLTISKNGTLAKSDFADTFSVALFRTTHNWLIHAKIGKGDLVDGQTTYNVKETFVIGDSEKLGWESPSPYFWLSMVPTGYNISVDHYQVEKGTMATDWTPAPEDTDSAISQIKQTADRIQAQVNDNKGNISSVTQTANAVKTDLANTKGDVASIKVKADSLTTQLADAKGNISSLQQTATGIQSTVQSQSGKISQLQQDADGLSATVGGAAIDVIPNLDQPFVMGYGIANTVWQDGNAYIKLPTTRKAWEVLPQSAGFTMYIPWQAGKTYMQSIIFETDAKVADGMLWTWYTANNGHMIEDATLVKLGNNTYRLIGSHTPAASEVTHPLRILDIYNFNNVVDVTTGTYLKFRNPRIWCPDDNSLAQLKLTADGLTSKVADTQGNVSSLQQTATMMQKQIADNKGNISSVKNTAEEVRTDLTNANHDIASLKVKADSLTSSMANANKQISTLQQRADSITSTLSNGGVNLLNNSRTFGWGITGWNGNPTHTIIDDGDGLKDYKIVLRAGAGNDGFWWPGNNTLNQTYTLSFDAKSDNGIAKLANVGLEQNFLVSNWTALSTGWMRYSVSGKVTHAGNNWVIYFSTTTADNVYVRRVQLEYGETATPWQPSNGDISSLQQTASQLTSDMKDAKGNISTLQQTAGGLTSDVRDSNKNISSLQQTAKELDAQIKAVDGRATTIKATADGISARVSGIENNKVVGSLLKLTDSEAGLGSYVNGKLIAGINTNTNGNVVIDGKQIHLTHYTQIDDGCINASKITVHNSVGNANGEAKDQYLAAAWGQLNSTIGKTTDNGKTTLWGSINQTADKFSSYYTRSDIDNKLSQQSSLISQTADNITAIVNDAKNFTTYTVSSSNTWDFNYTKSIYGNWFLNGETTADHVYNGPKYTNGNKLTPYMYVTSRGPKDGSRFVVTVWKDNDPTQYQRVWSDNKWSEWVMLPNSQNLISAINLSPDSVKISGKNIELNGNTKVTGRLDLMQDSTRSIAQSINYHNPWNWNNAHIYFDNYLQLLGEDCNVWYTDTKNPLGDGNTFYSITTLTPGYLKFTTYRNKVSLTDENFDGQISRSYLDSSRLETPEVYTDKFVITGHHIRVRDNKFLMVSNKNGTNFDNYGSVGFQVWGGIVLGQNTIGAPSSELYFQRGNIDAILGQRYSDAPKLTLHAQKVVSQESNTVSSRLSVKTAITKVSYDRALMAVQNTDMYDYRYISDDSGQHYVSGIIDDIHDKPEYNMDPMLINQERTARIDANLLGYHHVVLQEILKRLDKLEAK